MSKQNNRLVVCSNIDNCDRFTCPHDHPHEETFNCRLPCISGSGKCIHYEEPDSIQLSLELELTTVGGEGGSDESA
jgi:hypothetical protein